MKPLDLLEQFDKGAGQVGFVATYEFEPQFFERRILAKKTFGLADRIVVFMDRGRYQELVNSGINVSGFNRRYLVVPVNRAPYVFHPKIYLAFGIKRADAIIGSSNCTNAGIGYNVELCSAFSLPGSPLEPDDTDQASVIRQAYDAIRSFTTDAGPLRTLIEDEFLKRAEGLYPWLDEKVSLVRGQIELLHSHRVPLWEQIVKRLSGQEIRKIAIISPFYDHDLDFIKRLRKHWSSADLTIVAQPRYATLTGSILASIFSDGEHRLFAATPKPGRRLHAKALAFETESGTFWLTGSPNATRAAFSGRNTEAALFFKTKERADYLLKESGISLKRIDPLKFEAGHDDEPADASGESPLTIRSAILRKDGTIECEIGMLQPLVDTALRIQNFNEKLAVLSLPFRSKGDNSVRVELTDSQIEQIRGAAVCEIKGTTTDGNEIVSDRIALVQVRHLLRESSGAGAGGNPVRKIEQTGENLLPYADSLGSIRDAVEFFRNCNIQFFDGAAPSANVRGTSWKPRDPYKPDTPPDWLNIPLGGSAADLRKAVIDFVERHRHDKLCRHARRGNLNGLANFMDIFRTTNSLLFAYHARVMADTGPVVPFGFVTNNIMKNLEALIGPFEPNDDTVPNNGFVAAIQANFSGDPSLVFERLRDERVPQMICAAAEAMVDVRAEARKLPTLDDWAASRLRWIAVWIRDHGQIEPTRLDVDAATLEYMPMRKAA